MIRTILSIAGKPGLYRLVSQGRNMLIVESLSTGKRTPAFAHDKVMSLGDIAMYTTGEDIPLADVFELVNEKTGGQPVDVKAIGGDAELRRGSHGQGELRRPHGPHGASWSPGAGCEQNTLGCSEPSQKANSDLGLTLCYCP